MTSELTVQDNSFQLSEDELQIIADSFMPGATEAELAVYGKIIEDTGFKPWKNEIYAIKRRNKDETGKWVAKWTFQVGIDALRKRAANVRLPNGGQAYAGSKEEFDCPITDERPNVAWVTISRLLPTGEIAQFQAFAKWAEYVQLNSNRQPVSQWRDKPFVMLSKCAEARALRKAFPEDLGGLYVEEEMMQADNELALEDAKTQEASVTSVTTVPAEELVKPILSLCDQNKVYDHEVLSALRRLDAPGASTAEELAELDPATLIGAAKPAGWGKIIDTIQDQRDENQNTENNSTSEDID